MVVDPIKQLHYLFIITTFSEPSSPQYIMKHNAVV